MPEVSVIIPCYNEQDTIFPLLRSIYEQDYPRKAIEVIIADGLSTDLTRKRVYDFIAEYPDLKIDVIDNPMRKIPIGLNLALKKAAGEYIIRMDAHSIPNPDYISRCIRLLKENKGDNVGGKWIIRPGAETWIAKSIAWASAHPFGVGDAFYRIGGESKVVDTVPFGAYRRKLIEIIGYYNEELLTNEDYEFNVRIKKHGLKIWFDPKISSVYISRATFKELARQYWRYGYWKQKMLRHYPSTIRWRQFLPPIFLLSLMFLLIVSFFSKIALSFLVSVILFYLLILLYVGTQAMINLHYWKIILGVMISIMVMHFCWGSGFFWSVFKS